MKITIDKKNLSEFVRSSNILNRIESDVSSVIKLPIVFSDTFIAVYQLRLSLVKVKSVNELETQLLKNAHLIKLFLVSWYSGPKENRRTLLPAGITIGFLCWALALEQGGVQQLNRCVEKSAFTKGVNPVKLAKSFEMAYLEAKRAEQS